MNPFSLSFLGIFLQTIRDDSGNPLLRAGEGDEHGSHVLGIIGATRDNGVGIDGINDKAPLWVGRAIGSGQWARSLREFVDAAKRARQLCGPRARPARERPPEPQSLPRAPEPDRGGAAGAPAQARGQQLAGRAAV